MPISDDARATIATGLTWIFDTVQPDGVIDSHHGLTRTVGDRTFMFIPRGYAGSPIAVMEIRDGARSYNGHGDLINPLTHDDVAEFKAALADLGYEQIEHWNGAGTSTVSVQLVGQAHPTLTAAIARYNRGCPTHNSVFCSRDNCTWFRDGREMLISPTWPSPIPATS